MFPALQKNIGDLRFKYGHSILFVYDTAALDNLFPTYRSKKVSVSSRSWSISHTSVLLKMEADFNSNCQEQMIH